MKMVGMLMAEHNAGDSRHAINLDPPRWVDIKLDALAVPKSTQQKLVHEDMSRPMQDRETLVAEKTDLHAQLSAPGNLHLSTRASFSSDTTSPLARRGHDCRGLYQQAWR